MAEPFIGEIRMFAGTFAPRGWAFCDGQLLSISQNDALFALFGTTYGGDGRTTFGLPEARGRVTLHEGQGPGLSNRPLGQKSGVENVTVTANQLPVHTHAAKASTDAANAPNPSGAVLATPNVIELYSGDTQDVDMASTSITSTGGNQQHTNVQPFLCINCIVALFGIFPSRQ